MRRVTSLFSHSHNRPCYNLMVSSKVLLKFPINFIVCAALVLLDIGSAQYSRAGSARSEPGNFGLGLILGDPTGLSLNYELGSKRSIDAALAWTLSGNRFRIHADHLWHIPNAIELKNANPLGYFYGVGGRIILSNKVNDKSNNSYSALGVRASNGLRYRFFNAVPIEVFLEVALNLNLVPATDVDADFALGARYYF